MPTSHWEANRGAPDAEGDGSSPTLNSGISASEVRSLIGAGTSSSSGVTAISTTSPILGGTGSPITSSVTISITTATASAIGAGNVAVNGAGAYDGLRLSYSGGTATVGLDPQSLPGYTGTASGMDTSSVSIIINNEYRLYESQQGSNCND